MHLYFSVLTVGVALAAFQSVSALPHKSDGCGKPLPVNVYPGGLSQNLTVFSKLGEGIRRYLFHLPKAFFYSNDQPASLILAFHG